MKGMIAAGILVIGACAALEVLGFWQLRAIVDDTCTQGFSPMAISHALGSAQACWIMRSLLLPAGLTLLVVGLCLYARRAGPPSPPPTPGETP